MGYYGRLELKLKAQKMRRLGKSYIQIMKVLHLSKSTVSDWCKDVPLTKNQIHNLYESKKSGALKGSIIAASNKKVKRIQLSKKLYHEGLSDVGLLSSRDRFISGIAFYAAEGTKIDKGCCFSNSDPYIVKFMVDWFIEFGNISKDKFRGALWLHEGLDEKVAKQYWSGITNIPLKQFYKTYISKNKLHSKKIRKNIHTNGVFSFYINDVALIRKVMGWIGGIVGKPWYNGEVHLHSPVAQR